MTVLPNNWVTTDLESIAEILDYKRIPINSKERQKRKENKRLNELYPYYGATGQVDYINDYLFDGEYVLLGEDGAPFLDPLKNKAYIVSGKFWVNNHAHILKGYISNKYLCFYLNQYNFIGHVTGTTRLKLNQSSMKNITIKVAPLNEQSRIVEKIEELFSDLDKATEDLKKSQVQLKIYRQAVLKKLLTNKNWKTQKLKNMCTITSSKRIFKKEYIDKGVPFYRTKEIVELSKGKKISFELYISSSRYNEIKDKFDTPTKGDILISAVGTIGISYIVPDNRPFYFKDGNILWIKNLKYLIPQFLNYILNHFVHSKIKNITAGTAYSALTIEKLKILEVPTPTYDIQNKIVNEIDSRFSVCDKLEETVNKSLEKIKYLRQSILKKAFEGNLVPQNPEDEPVEKLLERIKQEKEKFELNKKKRK